MVQCLIYLDEPEQVASILENLIRANNVLMAYQLGLDLYENASQQFLLKVRNLLKALITVTQPMDLGDSTGGEVKKEEDTSVATAAVAETKPAVKVNEEIKASIDKLLIILNGEITIGTNMQFLIKNNHSDLLILKTIKVKSFLIYYKLPSKRKYFEPDKLQSITSLKLIYRNFFNHF